MTGLTRGVIGGVLIGVAFVAGFFIRPLFTRWLESNGALKKTLSAQLPQLVADSKPLQKYRFRELRSTPLQSSQLVVDRELSPKTSGNTASNVTPTETTRFVFHFTTLGKTMTGVMTVPQTLGNRAPANGTQSTPLPVIVMVRGYVPLEQYQPGTGTQPAATAFAKQGYVTIAPDFLGYGGSDPESADSWEARFQKPLQLAELIRSIQDHPQIALPSSTAVPTQLTLNPAHLGIWAHSNGGQVALTMLEFTSWQIPTSLWAPVTAPFPYSVLFFSDEADDEGKVTRQWIADFEKHYTALDFSLTQYVGWLRGPLQIHHGDTDDSALQSWSTDFVAKIHRENDRRAGKASPSPSSVSSPRATARPSTVASPLSSPLSTPVPSPSPLPSLSPDPGFTEHWPAIDITYYKYAETDHNMRPNWQTVVDRDIAFFNKFLR